MKAPVMKSSTGRVLDAARDLHALQQLVTREALEQATGLKLSVVDERIRVLVNDGLMLRMQRGVFVPATLHPETRAMSKTVMPDGTVKIEIGDEVLVLTPHEDRHLALLQAGAAVQLTAIEGNRQAAVVHAHLSQRVLRLESENEALRGGRDAAGA